MKKFLELLELLKDYPETQKALMPRPRLFCEPFNLSDVHIQVDRVSQYKLILHWECDVYFKERVSSGELEAAKKEAMQELKHLIYYDLYRKLCEIQYMLKRFDYDKAEGMLGDVLEELK